MIDRNNDFDNKIAERLLALDLNTIPDEVLIVCINILRHPKVKWKLSIDSKDRIAFESNVRNLCGFDFSLRQLAQSTNPNSDPLYDTLFVDKTGVFTATKLDQICLDACPHSCCLKSVMIALIAYDDRKELDDILYNRASTHQFFQFQWRQTGLLRHIPKNVFDVAIHLLKTNQIWVSPKLKNGKVVIRCAYNCQDFYGIENATDLETINKTTLVGDYAEWAKSSKSQINDFCCTTQCRFSNCPVMVAGYLYYLQKSEQWREVEIERAYYNAHEKTILKENQQQYAEALQNFLSTRINEDVLKTFDAFSDNVNNVTSLAHSIANKDRKSLHFAIEREEGIDEGELIEAICNGLVAMRKVNDAKHCPIGDLFNNPHICASHMLTLVTGIYGFMERKDKDQYEKKASLIELFSAPLKDRYIVIIGTKEELEMLSSYSPKLRYIYEHFKVSVNDLTVDQLYHIYKTRLDSVLFEELLKNEQACRKEFDQFIECNRSLFPFKNVDLAKYMAEHSNAANKLEFPPYVYKAKTLDESLSGVIGMENIKSQMKDLEKYIAFTNKAKSLGLTVPDMTLHMVFTGNPGCGKTMMAKIMARMLYDIGAIKENKFIKAERKDFIAKYNGQTAHMTATTINKALGGVLFIDEAYSLTPHRKHDGNSYEAEAIATLIKAMEEHKNDLVVIFAGYKDEMKSFIDSNPGIASRIGYTFDFNDYTTNELIEILKTKIDKNGFKINDMAIKKVEDVISVYSSRKNFGNGRFIDRLTQQILINHAKTETNDITTITETSIPTASEFINGTNIKPRSNINLDEIVGMDNLKKQIKDFADYIAFVQQAKNNGLSLPAQNMHMMFTGNPGCGKTTIARIIAKILFDMNVLHENKLIEVEQKDLIGQYVGQTAPKTSEVIEKALGGVLFIDEAYTLAQSDGANNYGNEAIATLVKAMEDKKGELIVIFAGYKEEMHQFCDSNPGIASRIGYTFDFPDYTPNELVQIYELKMKRAGLVLSEEASINVMKIMKYFHRVENIGNGRFADRLVQTTLINHAKIQANNNYQSISTIDASAIPTINAVVDMLTNGSNMLKPDQIDAKSIKKTAIHEIGHAYVRYKLFDDPQIVKITINAEGAGTLGYVEHKTQHDATNSKTELLNKIKSALAGMASETFFNGEFENGNTADLKQATEIATNMVTKYGMSDLGFARREEKELSESVYAEINKILTACYNDAKKIIEDNKRDVVQLINHLLKHRELSGEEFMSFVNNLAK